MSPFLAVLLAVFVLAGLAIGIGMARRPLIGRIALREAVRRPGQTAVLAIGLMVAGAAIFSIQVIFDTMYETNRIQVLQAWGRDDVEVSGGGAYFDAGLAQQLAPSSTSCSCIAAVQNAVTTSGSVVDLTREAGKPNVQITGFDLAAEQPFGSFVLATGKTTLGDELSAGRVFLTQSLADALGAQTGDLLRVLSGGQSSHDVTVAGIVRREGPGAYGYDRSMFASLATAQLLAGTDRVNIIRVSATGEGDGEVTSGHAAAIALRELLSADGASLQVVEVKSAALDIVVKSSENGRPFVSSFGVIVALAATALVANLAVMLAEERRPRLAVLRAMGLTRTGLVQLSVTEGAMYSVLGAIAGVPAGLLLVFLLFHGPGALAPLGTNGPVGLVFSVHIESVLGSVAAAALLNLVTVFLASLRTTGMTISAAIRDLPEPTIPRRPSRRRLAFLVVVALAGLAGIASGRSFLALGGGALMIAAAAGLVRGRVSDRVRYSAAGAAAAGWALVDYQYAYQYAVPRDTQPDVFAVALVVSVFALSVLMATNLSLLETAVGLVGRMSGGLRATLRPAMAYTSRRPVRAGLVIAAFSIVMAMLILAQSLVSASAHNYRVTSGGWDVQAVVAGNDQLSVPAAVQSEVARQEELPSRAFFGAVKWVFPASDFRGTTGWQQASITVFGLTQQQLQTGIGFGTPGDWSAIAHDPSLVASTEPVGSVIYLGTANGVVTFHVAAQIPPTNTNGINSSIIVPGIIASRESLDELAASAPGAMLLLTTAPGTSAGTLARDLQRALLSTGADVSTTKALVDEENVASAAGPVGFLILLMRVGLLVGIASLGAVALRAVVERRRSIGMLRAIGYQPAQVLIGMLVETAAVATAGLAVGLAVAYALGATLIVAISGGQKFDPDLGSIGLTIGLVYAAVLLVTLLPALRAARLRPAEALRVMG
jgi:putative ABC transport system permease protein